MTLIRSRNNEQGPKKKKSKQVSIASQRQDKGQISNTRNEDKH